MKLIFISSILLFVCGCSFTKKVAGTNSAKTNLEQKNSNKIVLTKTQNEIVDLIFAKDNKFIADEMVKFESTDLSFNYDIDKSTTDLLIEQNDAVKIALFSKRGLDLAAINGSNEKMILSISMKLTAKYLNSLSDKGHETITNSEENAFSTYSLLIEEIWKYLLQDDINGAINFSRKNFSRGELLSALIISYSQRAPERNLAALAKYVTRVGAVRNISTSILENLYKTELQRLFQNQFSDVSILNLLVETGKINDFMIPLSDSGIKISPWALLNLSKRCTLENMNAEPAEGIGFINKFDGACSSSFDMKKPKSEKECLFEAPYSKECSDQYKIPHTNYDLTIKRGDERLYTLEYITYGGTRIREDMFQSQVFAYMYGSQDTYQDWSVSLSFIFGDIYGEQY